MTTTTDPADFTTAEEWRHHINGLWMPVRIGIDAIEALLEEAKELLNAVPHSNFIVSEVTEGIDIKANYVNRRAEHTMAYHDFRQNNPGDPDDTSWNVPQMSVFMKYANYAYQWNQEITDWTASGDDINAFREWFEVMAALGEEVEQYDKSLNAWNSARENLGYAGQRNTKLLHGFLVKVWTTRRSTIGVVDSGRGKTAHIRPIGGHLQGTEDAITITRYSRSLESILVHPYSPGGQWERLRWLPINTPAEEWSSDTERYSFKPGDWGGPSITVLATTDVVQRMIRLHRLVLSVRKAAYDQAKSDHEAVAKWQDAGGRAAMTRKDKIDKIDGTVQALVDKGLSNIANNRYLGETREQFIAALADLDEAAVKIVADGARKRLLVAEGGPITEEEQTLIDTAPDESVRNLDMSQVARARFGPLWHDQRDTIRDITYMLNA